MLFLPDQHLGRNTAVLKMGLTLDDCVVWDPHRPNGGLTTEQLRDAKMILWKGHCSVHGRFSEEVVDELRATIPGVQILVHPECKHEVVLKADLVGSTEFIIKTIEAAPAGSAWAIGTELNLVKRLAAAHPDKRITFLDKTVCYCSTMNRIDLPHFVWAMESLVAGQVVNRIEVDPETEKLRPGRPRADARPAGQDPQGLSRAVRPGSSNQAQVAAVRRVGRARSCRRAPRRCGGRWSGRCRALDVLVDPRQRLEDPLLLVRRDAGAAVADLDPPRSPTRVAVDLDVGGSSPAALNLAALATRFCSTARSCTGSPTTVGQVADDDASAVAERRGQVLPHVGERPRPGRPGRAASSPPTRANSSRSSMSDCIRLGAADRRRWTRKVRSSSRAVELVADHAQRQRRRR